MQKRTRLAALFLIVSMLVAARASRADWYVIVMDDGYSFSPDPVYIVTGMVVYWFDDGSGPYTIYSFTGAWAPFQTPGGILFDQAGTYEYFDDVFDTGIVYVSDNVPPTVAITNPTNNQVFNPPASFTFAADASDTDADGLSDVEFYVGTNRVDDVFFSPFATDVTNLPAGNYTLTAIAYDNVFATATNSVNILVQNPAPILLTTLKIAAGGLQFTATGLTVGKTNILQCSTNLGSLAYWVPISTNTASTSSVSFTNAISGGRRFFRLLQLP
jgi:hypothetical protein